MNKLIFFILLMTLGIQLSLASELSWLSGTPPASQKHEFRPSGMQHFMAYRERGQEKLILWYRVGKYPQSSEYLDTTLTENASILFFPPSGKQKNYLIKQSDNSFAITYNFDEEGYHYIYIIEKWLEGNTLRVHVAKAERLSHKCQNGHRKVKQKVKLKTFDNIPFDINRLRLKGGEDLHLVLESGDFVNFQVLCNGKEVKNAKMTFTSYKNWVKQQSTNEAGIAGFQIISDYFSKWKEFEKEKNHHYLVTASYTKNESGHYKGQEYKQIKYTATFAGDYIPSKTWYQSNAWAMVIVFVSIALLTLGIFYYRIRFKRPY